MRGLSEELGIAAEASQLAGPLAPTHRRELHQGAFHDVELVQSYRCGGWAGAGGPAWEGRQARRTGAEPVGGARQA